MFEVLQRCYHIGESSWCFEGRDKGYYIFGDMYSDPRTNQELVNFLHDFGLYETTQFYKWPGMHECHTLVGNKLLNFHRTNVWISRIPMETFVPN